MKKLLLFLAILVSANLFSQDITKPLIPVLKGNKYGFATENMKIIIKPAYDFAYPFFPGYEITFAISDDKPLIINRKGKTVFKGSTDYLRSGKFSQFYERHSPEFRYGYGLEDFCFSDSCPEVCFEENVDYGSFLDKMGKLYFVSKQGKVYLIDRKGNIKSSPFDKISHSQGFYDRNVTKYTKYEHCISSLIIKSTDNKSDSTKYGLIGKDGEIIKECIYDKIVKDIPGKFIFYKGDQKSTFEPPCEIKPVVFKNKDDDKKERWFNYKRLNKKIGIVDTLGNILIKPIFNELIYLKNKKFAFLTDSTAGIMDIDGNHIYENKDVRYKEKSEKTHGYFAIKKFTDSLAFFDVNNKFELIDLSGNTVGLTYDGIYIDYQKIIGNISSVCRNGKLGVIDKDAKEFIPVIYDTLQGFEDINIFLCKRNNKWEYLDENGNMIYTGFDDFVLFPDGYLYIKKENKWFYIDSKGNCYFTE